MAGLALSGAAEIDSVRVQDMLRTLHFQQLKSLHYYRSPMEAITIGEPAVTFGYNKITLSGQEENLFVVVVRGTDPSDLHDYLTDAASVFGAFSVSAENVQSELESYMIRTTGCTLDQLKAQHNVFFVTGHSLGGAVSNLLCDRLRVYSNSAIFGYTFAAPRSTYNSQQKGFTLYNILNSEDRVPLLLSAQSLRNGSDKWFCRKDYPYNFNNKFMQNEVL